MKKLLLILILVLMCGGCVCQHEEVEELGREKRVYCKQCHKRVFKVDGEWRISKEHKRDLGWTGWRYK